MRFQLSQLGLCPGGNHVTGKISVNGGALRDFMIQKSELAADDNRDMEALIKQRCRSVVLESGASTNAQIKTALEAQEWKI